jgi:RNA polymerase sigma factor (sigma-70 family)
VGDTSARFQDIYEAYSGRIYAYALRRTGDPEAAGDVVAETFLVAWRKLADVPVGDEARPWLYAVARRVLSTQRRGERRRGRLTARLQFELPRNLDAGTGLQGDDLELIASAFNQLSASDQELLTLVGWEGLCVQDLATALQTSRATVRVRLHRARRRFERELGEVGLQRRAAAGHEPGRWASAHPDLEEA